MIGVELRALRAPVLVLVLVLVLVPILALAPVLARTRCFQSHFHHPYLLREAQAEVEVLNFDWTWVVGIACAISISTWLRIGHVRYFATLLLLLSLPQEVCAFEDSVHILWNTVRWRSNLGVCTSFCLGGVRLRSRSNGKVIQRDMFPFLDKLFGKSSGNHILDTMTFSSTVRHALLRSYLTNAQEMISWALYANVFFD